VISITTLNGSSPIEVEQTVVIASGTYDDWRWKVRAVPALVHSWNLWRQSVRIQERAQHADDWTHPVATWDQGFRRAHEVAEYLLGREPAALTLTVLLVPQDSKYHRTVKEPFDKVIPLTFAFYYPATTHDNTEETNNRLLAMVKAVSTSMHEYQHVLNRRGLVKAAGHGKVDQTINDEVRSNCWENSVNIALTSGSHSSYRWDPANSRSALLKGLDPKSTDRVHPDTEVIEELKKFERRYPDASLWGEYLEQRSTAAYLAHIGIGDLTIHSNEPEKMNGVLSACRAITRDPADLVLEPYPPTHVQNAPFFTFEKQPTGGSSR
jgi:hypothetical protein